MDTLTAFVLVFEFFHYLLSNQNFATICTMRAFGKTGCCTCWLYCLVYNNVVWCLFGNLLSPQNFATSGAMATFGKTSCCACCRNCFVNNYCVSKFAVFNFASDVFATS